MSTHRNSAIASDRFSYRAEMCVAEAGRVFQAVTETSVEGGMSGKYQGDLPEKRKAGQNTGDGQQDMRGVAVGGVVETGAHLPTQGITDKAQVRCEEQEREYPEFTAKMKEHSGARGKNRRCFQTKKPLDLTRCMAAVRLLDLRFPAQQQSPSFQLRATDADQSTALAACRIGSTTSSGFVIGNM
nr:hypothetical protein [Roseivivax sediminis]